MIAIDLSKQQALDAEPKVIQQINFTINVDRRGNTIILLEEAKKKKNCQYFVNMLQNFHQYKKAQYNSLNVKLLNSQQQQIKVYNRK